MCIYYTAENPLPSLKPAAAESTVSYSPLKPQKTQVGDDSQPEHLCQRCFSWRCGWKPPASEAVRPRTSPGARLSKQEPSEPSSPRPSPLAPDLPSPPSRAQWGRPASPRLPISERSVSCSGAALNTTCTSETPRSLKDPRLVLSPTHCSETPGWEPEH